MHGNREPDIRDMFGSRKRKTGGFWQKERGASMMKALTE
jgi:hypothetical protein